MNPKARPCESLFCGELNLCQRVHNNVPFLIRGADFELGRISPLEKRGPEILDEKFR